MYSDWSEPGFMLQTYAVILAAHAHRRLIVHTHHKGLLVLSNYIPMQLDPLKKMDEPEPYSDYVEL